MIKKIELNKEQLDKVNGGTNSTYMHCSICGHSVYWQGADYVGKTYECPNCKNESLYGLYADEYEKRITKK